MRFCFLTITILIISSVAICQSPAVADSVKTTLFYIAGVTDSRIIKVIDKLPRNSEKNDDSLVSLEEAINTYVKSYHKSDTNAIPVIIDIRRFEVKNKAGDSSNKELDLLFNYQLKQDSLNIDFAYYSFKRDLYKYMKTPKHFSIVFRKEIPEMLDQLNDFISKSLNSFAYRGVNVNSTVEARNNLRDTVFYDKSRKLSWNDFKGKPDKKSTASAITASSFNYYTQSSISNGYLNIDVSLECYFLPKQSWVKPFFNEVNGLAHEQLHFDITCLWTLKLRNAINTFKFPITGWQSELAILHTRFYNEMAVMQNEYDRESENGRNAEKQAVWQKQISYLLLKSPL